MSRKPVVVILHGPAGVGKDSVIDGLRSRTGIQRAMSSTDRPMRDYERDGVHYHFLTTAEFEDKIARGEFIEYARVYDQWKGVEAAEILRHLEAGDDLIIRTDVNGARTWRERLEGAVSVFLTAEDVDVLRQRLIARGTEDGASLQTRLAELDAELADIPNNDYVIVNHHGRVDDAVDELAGVIEGERANPERPCPRLRENPARQH